MLFPELVGWHAGLCHPIVGLHGPTPHAKTWQICTSWDAAEPSQKQQSRTCLLQHGLNGTIFAE